MVFVPDHPLTGFLSAALGRMWVRGVVSPVGRKRGFEFRIKKLQKHLERILRNFTSSELFRGREIFGILVSLSENMVSVGFAGV